MKQNVENEIAIRDKLIVGLEQEGRIKDVITSYSIHYTKVYDFWILWCSGEFCYQYSSFCKE